MRFVTLFQPLRAPVTRETGSRSLWSKRQTRASRCCANEYQSGDKHKTWEWGTVTGQFAERALFLSARTKKWQCQSPQ